MQETTRDIKSMTIEELAGVMKENGFPAFRAKQLYRWMHVSLVRNYEEMTNIPKVMAERLSKEYPLTTARMIDRQVSKLDGTQKYLFAMGDDSLVESVFMRYKFGNSVCISCSCATNSETASASLPRWDAEWDADSAPPPWTACTGP